MTNKPNTMRQIRIVAVFMTVMALLVGFTAPTHAAGLLIADGGFGGVLEIKEHDVRVTVNNGIAVTDVTQVFVNTENRIVEALYTFPVPKNASVANFSMWIGGKEMIGEVVEKQRARQIYESYKKTRKDPGLLEQVDYKRFEMRIFPIAARAEQRVRITYYQELDTDHDWMTYTYPLNTTTRRADTKTTGRFAITIDALSQIPIVEVDSPSHGDDLVPAKHTPEYLQASLETSKGDLNRDVVLAWRTSRPRTGIDVITSKPKGEDGYFALTLTAGEELARFDSGMDFVFITDISGSMRDERKLAMSRILVKRFVDELGEKDRFELMTFNVASDALFDQLRDVTNDNRRQAASFMHSRVARGGTNLMLAVRTAYQYRNDDASRPLNVVILSDGMTEHKQKTELIQLIDERPKRTRVFCIGVGNEVNRPLLSQIADDSGGMAAFISRGDNFERAAKSFRQKLTRPMATDLAFKFSGVEVYDVTPRQIPNLYFGTPVRIYGRYKNGGDVTASLSANVIGKPINKSVTVELPRTDDANPEIDRMWAWHRVQGLLKQADRVGSRDSVVNAIIALGEGYSIVTEHTSFIVLENDAEYRRWKIDRRNAIRIERDRAGQDRLAKRLAELREKATTRLAPIGDDEPAVATPATPQVNTNNVPAPARQQSRRSRDIDFGFSGGAGAIDPVGGLIVLGMGGSALLARRRRRGSTIR